jgi:hypothetical protein
MLPTQVMRLSRAANRMRSSYPPSAGFRPGLSGLINQEYPAGNDTRTKPSLDRDHRARSWRLITYPAVLLPLLFLASLVWMQRDFNRWEIPDWKSVIALADSAREKGDLYYAKSLYAEAGRLAAWREDWAGLVAAACGMNRLEKQKGPYSSTNALLLRAMVAAETRQSRSGMAAVANAFAEQGEVKVASTAISRIRKDWAEETNNSADIVSPGCWGN